MAGIEKQFGKGAIMTLGDEDRPEPVAVIPSGSLALDHALGIGGYPRGRIVEIYGPESSGKTTLTLHAIAEAQRRRRRRVHRRRARLRRHLRTRHRRRHRAAARVASPTPASRRSRSAEMLTRSGAVDLVVIDSVAALTPKAEIEGEMGDAHMGLQARLMSQALRKLTAVAHRTDTTLIFINQLRQKIGVVFGNPETTTGGNALKFYASVRLDVRRIGPVKVGRRRSIGIRTRVKVVKNKCAPPVPRRPSSTSAGARASTRRRPARSRRLARRRREERRPPLLRRRAHRPGSREGARSAPHEHRDGPGTAQRRHRGRPHFAQAAQHRARRRSVSSFPARSLLGRSLAGRTGEAR